MLADGASTEKRTQPNPPLCPRPLASKAVTALEVTSVTRILSAQAVFRETTQGLGMGEMAIWVALREEEKKSGAMDISTASPAKHELK